MKIKLHVLITTALFVLTGCNETAKKSELKPTLETVGESLSDNDVVINLAVANFENYTYEKELIEKFNETDNGYYIKVLDYADMYDIESEDNNQIEEAYAKADQQIINDILHSNKIDMAFDLLNGERVISLSQKGAFVNLIDFIKNDPDFDYNDLNSHVLDICKINDALYYMPLGYVVNTMYGYQKYVGNVEDWNISTMKSRWSQMPEGSAFSKTYYYNDNNSSDIFFELCMKCTSAFMDPQTNKCSFDSSEYIELLEFANSFEKEVSTEKKSYGSEYFLAPATINGFAVYQEYNFNEGIPEKLSFVGYPSKEGSNSFISLYGDCEICAKSSKEVQQGAWEFMKYIISEDTQYETYFPGVNNKSEENNDISYESSYQNKGFPINNKAFDKKANELISAPKNTNMIAIAGESYDMGNLTQEELLTLKDIILRTNNIEFGIYNLYDIIYDEVGEMLNGNRNPEQTAKIIQNRASILMSE